jgi:hypothetical protein
MKMSKFKPFKRPVEPWANSPQKFLMWLDNRSMDWMIDIYIGGDTRHKQISRADVAELMNAFKTILNR